MSITRRIPGAGTFGDHRIPNFSAESQVLVLTQFSASSTSDPYDEGMAA